MTPVFYSLSDIQFNVSCHWWHDCWSRVCLSGFSDVLQQSFIRRHCWQVTAPIANVPWYVCLSVCHIRTLCLNGRRYRNCLLRVTAPCLFQIVLKFGLHRSALCFSNLTPKWPTPCWFECQRHLMANCDQMVRYSAVATTDSLVFFQWDHRWPYHLPFLQNMGPRCTTQVQLCNACCHLAVMIEDFDKISFTYEQCHLFTKLLWPLWRGIVFSDV